MADYTFPKIPTCFKKGDTITFEYTGSVQELDLNKFFIGKAKIECWGASGSGVQTGYHSVPYTYMDDSSGGIGIGYEYVPYTVEGKGGYAWGELDFSQLPQNVTSLYFVVGECGAGVNHDSWGTFGGGGGGGSGDSGGGASDVRTYYDPNATDFVYADRKNPLDNGICCQTTLKSRLIVGSGGGARDGIGSSQGPGYPGVAWSGSVYPGHFHSGGDGGQTGSQGDGDWAGAKGMFGIGGSGGAGTGGGGGGWYGGSASDNGGGGSCYVAGNPNCPISTLSGVRLTNSGAQGNVNVGNGRIKLTIIEPGIQLSGHYLCQMKPDGTVIKIPLFVHRNGLTGPFVNVLIKNGGQRLIAFTKELKTYMATDPSAEFGFAPDRYIITGEIIKGTNDKYRLYLAFAKVNNFPIKYTSSSGAKIVIEKNKLNYNEQNDTYVYIFSEEMTLDELKSVYPHSGEDDYSSIYFISISERTTRQSTGQQGAGNCMDGRRDCDCAGDFDCDRDDNGESDYDGERGHEGRGNQGDSPGQGADSNQCDYFSRDLPDQYRDWMDELTNGPPMEHVSTDPNDHDCDCDGPNCDCLGGHDRGNEQDDDREGSEQGGPNYESGENDGPVDGEEGYGDYGDQDNDNGGDDADGR